MASPRIAECKVLFKKLRDAVGSKVSFADPALRQLREDYKNACYNALVCDYNDAQKEDLEKKLWRFVFYVPINEFRNRLASNKNTAPEDPLRAKTLIAYLKFLQETENFYRTLIDALKSTSVSGHDRVSEALIPTTSPNLDQSNNQHKNQVSSSISRCLICIGDSKRYAAIAQSVVESTQSMRDSYAEAVELDPSRGHAWNQLGVVDEMMGDRLSAAYFYLCSQYSQHPFPAAAQNAGLLFGSAALIQTQPPPSSSLLPKVKQSRGSMPTNVLEKEIIAKYLHILGCIHEKIDLDATRDRLVSAGADLDELLNRMRQQWSTGGAAGAARRVGRAVNAAPRSLKDALSQRPMPFIHLLIAIPIIFLTQKYSHKDTNSNKNSNNNDRVAKKCAEFALLDIFIRILNASNKLRLVGTGQARPFKHNATNGNTINYNNSNDDDGEHDHFVDAARACPVFTACSMALRWLHDTLCCLDRNSVEKSGVFRIHEGEDNVEDNVEDDKVKFLLDAPPAFWQGLIQLYNATEATQDSDGNDDDEKDFLDESILLPEDFYLVMVMGVNDAKVTKVTRTMVPRATVTITTATTNQSPRSRSFPIGYAGRIRSRRIGVLLRSLASSLSSLSLAQYIGKRSERCNEGGKAANMDAYDCAHETSSSIDHIQQFISHVMQKTTRKRTTITAMQENDTRHAVQEHGEDQTEEEIVFAPLTMTGKNRRHSGLVSAREGMMEIRTLGMEGGVGGAHGPESNGGGGGMDDDVIMKDAEEGRDNNNHNDNHNDDPQHAMELTGHAVAEHVLDDGGGGDGTTFDNPAHHNHHHHHHHHRDTRVNSTAFAPPILDPLLFIRGHDNNNNNNYNNNNENTNVTSPLGPAPAISVAQKPARGLRSVLFGTQT